MMRNGKLILSAAVLLASAGNVHAAEPTTASLGAPSRADRVVLTDAANLLNATIQDTQGREIGEMRYLMITPETGDVVFAIVSPSQAIRQPQTLAAIPLASMGIAAWPADSYNDRINLVAPRDKLAAAPRYEIGDLVSLTSPRVQREIYEIYMPLSSTFPPTAQDRSGDGSMPQILLDRGMATTILDPLARTSRQIAAGEIHGSDGSLYGEIDNLMIDIQHGQVAYALVSGAQSLGMGQQNIAVPLQALQWSPEGHYVLDRNADRQARSDGNQMPESEPVPARLPIDELGSLYSRFAVPPYWQPG